MKNIETLNKSSETKTVSVDEFLKSEDFQNLQQEKQHTARILIMYGTPSEKQVLLDKSNRDKVLDYAFVGFHEGGHGFAATDVGGRNVRTKILGVGEGVTTWYHSFRNSVSNFFMERMFVGFAGRKAVEALGYRSKGHGSDMAQINYFAKLYHSITGNSGEGLRNRAEGKAESFVHANQGRIIREGLAAAVAA